MTYAQFLLVFILPPIAGFLTFGRLPPPGPRWSWLGVIVICVIALTYTTPWDNYLVAREVWTYGPERVLAVIGWVPVEEYAFMLLQSIGVGMITLKLGGKAVQIRMNGPRNPLVRIGGGIAILVVGTVSFIALQYQPFTYAGLILSWASVPIAIQWFYGGDLIWKARTRLALLVAGPSLYLSLVDGIAIALGIWYITDATRLGWEVFGLPWEEALFFVITTYLVVITLFFWQQIGLRRMQP